MLARQAGHDPRFYCGRAGCGPMSGPQCKDCEGYTTSNIPPFVCYNRKGYEMLLGHDGKYYCGKKYSNATRLLGFNGGRCHPTKQWQCKHCQGFGTGSGQPPLQGRKELSVPELMPTKEFKNPKSTTDGIVY
jgi:hypothetical protein